jgi:hypothetical protein
MITFDMPFDGHIEIHFEVFDSNYLPTRIFVWATNTLWRGGMSYHQRYFEEHPEILDLLPDVDLTGDGGVILPTDYPGHIYVLDDVRGFLFPHTHRYLTWNSSESSLSPGSPASGARYLYYPEVAVSPNTPIIIDADWIGFLHQGDEVSFSLDRGSFVSFSLTSDGFAAGPVNTYNQYSLFEDNHIEVFWDLKNAPQRPSNLMNEIYFESVKAKIDIFLIPSSSNDRIDDDVRVKRIDDIVSVRFPDSRAEASDPCCPEWYSGTDHISNSVQNIDYSEFF